uniref:long-chain-fatty-acid--CoA ligase n=1 Tax=Spermophilus dauricus TaxID=99837 RepID=A0A8C9PQK9_SPEDA
MELGNSIPDTQLDQIIKTQKANQCAAIIYTSGTVGLPKGVMLSHDNVSAKPSAVGAGIPQQQEVVVSYLPLSHIAAQMMDMWVPIKIGAVIYFAESDALKVRLSEDLGPTASSGRPQGWRAVLVFLADSPCHFILCLTVSSVSQSLSCPLCSVLKPRQLLDEACFFIFLTECINVGNLADGTLGRPLLTSAGPSEHTVGDSVSEPRFPHSCPPGSCGKIVSGCENMLVQQNKDGTGEVCMWGRHIFMGYLDREDTTLETIDADGWLHSGDLGRMDNQGFLFITGRIKEILITAGGENVAPVPIENLVRERIPIISNAMLVGDRAKFLSILLTLKVRWGPAVSGAPLNKLSSEAVHFCRSLGSQADTVTEIVRQQDPLIYEAIQQGIDAVNLEATSEAQRIHKWVILEKDFSIPGGELGEWVSVLTVLLLWTMAEPVVEHGCSPHGQEQKGREGSCSFCGGPEVVPPGLTS